MIAILKTNNKENYKIVRLIKKRFSEQINLALVSFKEEEFLTGGILCDVNDNLIKVLDSISPEEQWDLLMSAQNPRCLL